MLKRTLAILCCLLWLPVAALAQAAEGVRFRLTFDMDAAAYPASVADAMPGVADLLDVLALEGTLARADGGFDLNSSLTLRGRERSRTELRVFGQEGRWHIRSPLLGGETLTVDLIELAEFAVKGYSHLGIPLQRVAILMPYVHKSGVAALVDAARPTLEGNGSRVISRDAVRKLAALLAETAAGDRAFRYWSSALFIETGYEELLINALSALPEWVDAFVPPDGIQVTVTDGGEVWAAGDVTLLRRETDRSGVQTLTLTLPPLPDGLTLAFDAALQPDGDMRHFSVDVSATDGDGETLLHAHATGTLPAAMPFSRPFSLSWVAEGVMIGDGAKLYFEGEPTPEGLVLRQVATDTGAVMLTVNAALEPCQANFAPEEPAESVAVLNLNDDSLAALMERIRRPLVRGLLPLIACAPASSCQTLMDLLESSGIFGMLTNGMAEEESAHPAGTEEDDGGWDPSGWDEGY